MSEWSQNKCLLLIESYKKNSLLWNPKDKDYYKKHLKEDVWAKIGDTVNETADTCKRKMINILASYRRERMKVKKSKKGKGKCVKYESKWYAYNILRFLDERATSRKQESSEQLDDKDDVANEPPAPAPAPAPCKKPKLDPKTVQIVKENSSRLQYTNKPQQDTELRSFFDFIQEKMKNYTRDTKNSIQHEIFQIIMRADQGYYDVQNIVYCSTQPSSIAKQEPLDLEIEDPSTSVKTKQSPPYSPYSNSSDQSSDINFEDLV